MRIHVDANFIAYFLREFLKEAILVLLQFRLHIYIIYIFSFERTAQSCFAVFWHLYSEHEILKIHYFSAYSQLSLIKLSFYSKS